MFADRVSEDTAAGCWLCNRDRGQFCHVHDSQVTTDDEPAVAERADLVWTTPGTSLGDDAEF